jgi:hypothetical protein
MQQTKVGHDNPLILISTWLRVPGCPLSPTQRLVALSVANHMAWHGQYSQAWPSVSTLCRFTGFKETAVKNALRQLSNGPDALFARTLGGLDAEGKHHDSYTYTLLDAPLWVRMANGTLTEADSAGSSRGATPPQAEGVSGRPRTGHDATPPAHDATPATEQGVRARLRERGEETLGGHDATEGEARCVHEVPIEEPNEDPRRKGGSGGS